MRIFHSCHRINKLQIVYITFTNNQLIVFTYVLSWIIMVTTYDQVRSNQFLSEHICPFSDWFPMGFRTSGLVILLNGSIGSQFLKSPIIKFRVMEGGFINITLATFSRQNVIEWRVITNYRLMWPDREKERETEMYVVISNSQHYFLLTYSKDWKHRLSFFYKELIRNFWTASSEINCSKL